MVTASVTVCRPCRGKTTEVAACRLSAAPPFVGAHSSALDVQFVGGVPAPLVLRELERG
jgi:hypothetical protein